MKKSTKDKPKSKIIKEKSYKDYLKENNIDKVKPDKFGRVKDPMDGKDYADYKLPKKTKKNAIARGWTEESGYDWKDW